MNPLEHSDQPSSGDDPPFLREDSFAVATSVSNVESADRLQDLFDTWRPGIMLLLAPVIVGVFALAYTRSGSGPTQDPVAAAGEPSAVEAMVAGVLSEPGGGGDETAAGRATTLSSLATTTSGAVAAPGVAGPTAAGGGGDSDGVAPVPTEPADPEPDQTAAPSTSSTSTSASSSTTEPSTTTTAPGTTKPPEPKPTTTTTTTTAPTTTTADLDNCRIGVRRRTVMRAEPSPDAEEVRRVSGFYRVRAISGSGDSAWYQISSRRSTGWVSRDRVSFTTGDCG